MHGRDLVSDRVPSSGNTCSVCCARFYVFRRKAYSRQNLCIEAGIKLLEICPKTKIVLVTESIPPEAVKRLAAQGYHFPTLHAPFTREELHAVVFGQSCA
jgi:hypothetical protein